MGCDGLIVVLFSTFLVLEHKADSLVRDGGDNELEGPLEVDRGQGGIDAEEGEGVGEALSIVSVFLL